MLVTVALLTWWLLAMRRQPEGDPFGGTTWQSFVLVLASTILAATTSILAAARLSAWEAKDRPAGS